MLTLDAWPTSNRAANAHAIEASADAIREPAGADATRGISGRSRNRGARWQHDQRPRYGYRVSSEQDRPGFTAWREIRAKRAANDPDFESRVATERGRAEREIDVADRPGTDESAAGRERNETP